MADDEREIENLGRMGILMCEWCGQVANTGEGFRVEVTRPVRIIPPKTYTSIELRVRGIQGNPNLPTICPNSPSGKHNLIEN